MVIFNKRPLWIYNRYQGLHNRKCKGYETICIEQYDGQAITKVTEYLD